MEHDDHIDEEQKSQRQQQQQQHLQYSPPPERRRAALESVPWSLRASLQQREQHRAGGGYGEALMPTAGGFTLLNLGGRGETSPIKHNSYSTSPSKASASPSIRTMAALDPATSPFTGRRGKDEDAQASRRHAGTIIPNVDDDDDEGKEEDEHVCSVSSNGSYTSASSTSSASMCCRNCGSTELVKVPLMLFP